MFGRRPRNVALACATVVVLALSQSTVTQHPASAATTTTTTTAANTAARAAAKAHHPFAMRTQHVRTNEGSSYVGPKPCSAYFGQKTAHGVPDALGGENPYSVCGYLPEQLRDAYGVSDSGLNGSGVTVAIVDAYASPTMLADADRYAANHGERRFRPGQFREVKPSSYNHVSDGECETPSDWAVEESLDVEAVHAMAPAANIVYVGAASCDDVDLSAALRLIVAQNLATIVSASWGGIVHSVYGDQDPAVLGAYSAIFQQGSRQGISFLFSSGDCGAQDPSTSCSPDASRPQTTYPAQDPWVTAVGGTSLGIGAINEYLGETGWGDLRSVLSDDGKSWVPTPGAYRYGAGGGTSEDVAQPWYQQGKVPTALASTLLTGAAASHPMRVVPDVAMDADPMTGFRVGLTEKLPNGTVGYGESAIGGTSLAAPLFAGFSADAQQAAGHPLGFLNPRLYAASGTRLLHDVTAHTLDDAAPAADRPLAFVVDLGADQIGRHQARLVQLGDDGLLAATRGYDDVTGVGSPAGSYLHSNQ